MKNQLIINVVKGAVIHPAYEEFLKKYPKGSGQNASIEKLAEIRDALFNVFDAIEKEPIVKLSVKEQAKQAIMFENSENDFLRMQFCDENSFTCLNEKSGEEYTILFTDVDLQKESFHKLTKI